MGSWPLAPRSPAAAGGTGGGRLCRPALALGGAQSTGSPSTAPSSGASWLLMAVEGVGRNALVAAAAAALLLLLLPAAEEEQGVVVAATGTVLRFGGFLALIGVMSDAAAAAAAPARREECAACMPEATRGTTWWL